jgi:hypothetical protein
VTILASGSCKIFHVSRVFQAIQYFLPYNKFSIQEMDHSEKNLGIFFFGFEQGDFVDILFKSVSYF